MWVITSQYARRQSISLTFVLLIHPKLAVRTLMLSRLILHGLVFKETFFSHILLTASPLPFTNRRLSQKVQINNQTDNEI